MGGRKIAEKSDNKSAQVNKKGKKQQQVSKSGSPSAPKVAAKKRSQSSSSGLVSKEAQANSAKVTKVAKDGDRVEIETKVGASATQPVQSIAYNADAQDQACQLGDRSSSTILPAQMPAQPPKKVDCSADRQQQATLQRWAVKSTMSDGTTATGAGLTGEGTLQTKSSRENLDSLEPTDAADADSMSVAVPPSSPIVGCHGSSLSLPGSLTPTYTSKQPNPLRKRIRFRLSLPHSPFHLAKRPQCS